MKILFVSTSTTLGGAEKTLAALATSIDRNHFSVAGVVSLKQEGFYARFLAQKGIKVTTLGLERAALPPDAKKLAAIISSERPDIVHALMYQAIQLSRMAKPLAGVPFKLISSPRVNYRTRSTWTVIIDRWLKNRDDLLIAECEASRRWLVEKLNYASTKVITIRNGVEAHPIPSPGDREKNRAELAIRADEILIGAIGRLDRQKGGSILIEAMSLLKGSPLRCAILGEGPERENLETLVHAHGLEGSVQLLGERSDVSSWFPAFDLYCLPSLWEGLPNALLEAMSWGLPVIASNVDGVPEAITSGREGLLVSPAKPSELAAALKSLADDPVRRAKLGLAAKAAVKERFLLTRMIAEYESAYEKVLRSAS